MLDENVKKRILDLADRCERKSCVTASSFLSPAECYEIQKLGALSGRSFVVSGGAEGCERCAVIFLPEWMSEDMLELSDYISAVKIKSFFGAPVHRDYLGAVLGLGIERDRIGDIIVDGENAWIFCAGSVVNLILSELDKVGRYSVKTEQVPLADVPRSEKKVKRLSFTVKSLRLDAVTADMFGISRTNAAEFIRLGAVSLNYSVCEKADAPVKEGDVISVRGKGKGCVSEVGGRSKKDRLFITAEIFI